MAKKKGRDEWAAGDEPVVVDTDDIEMIVNFGFDEDGDPEMKLRLSVLLVDADGDEMTRKYVRETANVEALFTTGMITQLKAMGDRARTKAHEDLVPA